MPPGDSQAYGTATKRNRARVLPPHPALAPTGPHPPGTTGLDSSGSEKVGSRPGGAEQLQQAA